MEHRHSEALYRVRSAWCMVRGRSALLVSSEAIECTDGVVDGKFYAAEIATQMSRNATAGGRSADDDGAQQFLPGASMIVVSECGVSAQLEATSITRTAKE